MGPRGEQLIRRSKIVVPLTNCHSGCRADNPESPCNGLVTLRPRGSISNVQFTCEKNVSFIKLRHEAFFNYRMYSRGQVGTSSTRWRNWFEAQDAALIVLGFHVPTAVHKNPYSRHFNLREPKLRQILH